MNDTVNIKRIYQILIDHRKYITKTTLIFFMISIMYVSFKTDYYKATISLYAAGELDDSSLLSQYGSLAENLGFATTPSSSYYIPDIIDSRSLKKEIIQKEWYNSKSKTKTDLITYWGIDKTGFISRIINSIKSIFLSNEFRNVEISQLNTAIENLDDLIYVDERNSGLIIVSVHMEEPQLAADIANYISDYVVNFIESEQKKFADKSKNFITDRMQISKQELNESEEKLTAFRKKHPLVLDTPDLQLDRARLIRTVDVNQEVFITLREQLEIAKIEASKERLFINILDKAEQNPKKDKPNRLLLILIITLCGLFISVIFQIIKLNIKKIILED